MKKMNKTRGIVYAILSLVIIACLGGIVLFGLPNWKWLGAYKDSGKAANITQGLDLKGGVSVTYQVSDDNPKWDATDLSDTVYKMQQRVNQFSTEATAYKEGDDRITVDIPGANDADEVVERLGKPGSLYFCTKSSTDLTEEQLAETDENGNKKYVQLTDGNYAGYYQIWLTGDDIADAQGQQSSDSKTKKSEAVVSLTFTDAGSTKFYNMTSQYVGKSTYIIYDNEVISAPTVQAAISGGQAQIDGMADMDEANNLASNIRIGTLNLSLDEISHKVVSAQLGSDALSKSIKAGIIGFIIIILFLLLVYRIAGVAASLALVVFVELEMLTLNAFDLTLSLPGIAGIILGIGMAVDANVIINARIREEIAAGKTVKSAITIGFDKAKSAIVDGNITTLIAALVLLWRGSGTVQGFAQTLAISIVFQLFTSLFVSKWFVLILYYLGFQGEKFYGKEKTRKAIHFLKKRVVFFALSIIVIIGGFATMIGYSAAGKDPFFLSVEFKGGSSVTVDFDKEYTMDQFNDEIKPALVDTLGTSDIQGQKETGSNKFVIKTKKLEGDEFDAFEKLLIEKFGAVDSKDNFQNTMISATVSKEMRSDAVWATIIATICMLIYIWIRFKDIKFASAAVIALIHDVLVVIGFYAVSRVAVGTTFIACLLTIVGYSINATIVIFDRIRENKASMKRGDDLEELVDLSITQTLTRTIYSNVTTFIMVFMIFIMGVTSIKEFTLPLMVGLVCGAYSSVCITGAVWFVLTKKFGKKKAN